MSTASLLFAFLAGVLTILSPCVLPLLPVLLSSASSEHRVAPAALAAGVGLSFAFIGAGLASLGFAAGPEATGIRIVSAVVLIGIGVVLLIPALQSSFAVAAGPFSGWIDRRLGGFAAAGLIGQFALGLLLGAVWTPCVGPTLGAATVLAARGDNLVAVALTMILFGLGTGLALAAMGLLSRSVLISLRGRMLAAGALGKILMGVALILIGAAILTGADKTIEAYLVDASPLWLTRLTTLY